MKKDKLSDAVGMIDSDIIEEAGEKRASAAGKPLRRRKPIYAAVAVFAAAAAAITGVTVVPRLIDGNTVGTSAVTDTAAHTEPNAAAATESTAASTGDTLPIDSGIPSVAETGFTRERPGSDIISDVTAVSSKGENIATDSALRINLLSDISEAELRDRIVLSPESGFTLTRDTDSSYLLKADMDFGRGSLVKLAVEDDFGDICDSWAFRTADKFAVESEYPAQYAGDVSISTGIEIEFTGKPSAEDAENHFSITPSVSGSFTVHEHTLYFVPTGYLNADTAYTVKLSKGLLSVDGEALEEDFEFTFRTTMYSSGNTYLVTGSSNSGFSEVFVPGDQTCVELYCSENPRSNEFETHLYRFGSAEDYFAAVKDRADDIWDNSSPFDTSGLEEVFTSNEVPFTREDSNGNWRYTSTFVILPEQLEKGCYIADISVAGKNGELYSVQYLIMVSPVSVYALSLGDENIFFVNNTDTGLAAQGAKVTLTVGGKEYSAVTDADGIAYIKTGSGTGKAMLSVTAGADRYIDSYVLSSSEEVPYKDMYYMYLYTDREEYLLTDTVNVWGLIIPKAHGTAVPGDLVLRFGSDTKPVKPGADGTFKTSFSFENHRGGYWNELSLMSGDNTLISKNVVINDFVKPTYTFDLITPDYAILPQIDPIPVTINASYFDGTPAEGVMFRSESGESEPKFPTTDADGTVQISYGSGDASDEMPWTMSSMYMSYSLAGIENSYSNIGKQIPAFYRNRMSETEYDEDTRDLTVRVYDMDFSRIGDFMDTTTSDGWYTNGGDYGLLRGAPADIPVTVSITHRWNEPVESGSYYDYIEKQTVKIYRYEYHYENVGTYTANTVNGTVVFSALPTDSGKGYYEIEIKYADSLGQPVKETIFPKSTVLFGGLYIFDESEEYGSSMWYEQGSRYLVYRLDASTAGGSRRDASWRSSYSTFSENEDISFELVCSNGETEFNGKLLLAVYKNDILSYEVYDAHGKSDFTYTATKDCIPDARYTGAYFDGKHVYKVSGSYIFYDPGERRITLDASSDRETYDAGDTAVISVKAADVNGNAVSGATVMLSLVDEAAFAVMDQNADPLDDLYSFVWYPAATSYVSYIQHLAAQASGGEMGGGGPGSVRKDFKDTAYFDTAVTDKDGNAVFTVKLPDNLTTWRATILAVYETDEGRLLSGDKKLPVVTTRPVFITPVMHSQYIVGDDITVSARCAGMDESGTMTVTLTGSGVNETRTIRQRETANFGKLSAGGYTVLFTAESGGSSDAVEMPITVTDTLLETDIRRTADLQELSDTVNPTKWPVSVSFFDKEYMFCTDILYDMLFYSGESLDMRLGAAYAAKELGFITDEDILDMFSGETAEGFAQQLPSSPESSMLTAEICAAIPEAVSASTVSRFRNDIEYGESFGKKCADYMGLAALGEPVLNEVKEIFATNDIPYTPSAMYLSAALAFCGDYRSAYEEYIKAVPEITVVDSDPDAPYAFIPQPNGEANEAHTKAALITASLLNLPEAEYFARYLVSTDRHYSGYALELVVYLRYYVPKTPGDAVFTYNRDGVTQTVRLNRHHPTTILFSKEQFDQADIRVQSGAVYTISDYVGRVDENSTAPTLNVIKTLKGTMAPGEEITVTIKALPYCTVYDVIPSCGRLTGSQQGQLIQLYTDNLGYASYKFTISTAGEYVVESAVVYDHISGAWGLSERKAINVGDGNETA